MIVKFFRHGTAQKGKTGSTGGGGAVRDYLLKDPNDKTKDRKGATLIRGNADQTTEVINNINRKARYKSGVLSFAKGEIVSDEQKQEIIDSFENTLFVGLDKDQYSGYWVEHQDKDRLELHFVFAETELKTGKSLAIYYHKVDKSLVDTWKDLTNDKYNLLDPNDPMTKKAITPNTLKTRNDKDNALKDEISERILIAIEKDPNVKTRDDVVKLIESLDYKVNRSNQFDSISIRHPDEKDDKKKRPLRLKGDIFSKDFSRDCLPSQREKQKIQYDKDHDNRIAQTQSDYQKYLALREKRTLKRIGTIDRTPYTQELSQELDQIRADNEPSFIEKVEQIRLDNLANIASLQNGSEFTERERVNFDRVLQSGDLDSIYRHDFKCRQVIATIEAMLHDDPYTPIDDDNLSQYRYAKAFNRVVDDMTDQRYKETANYLAERVLFDITDDELQAIITAPERVFEPEPEILRSDEGKPQLTPTPTPEQLKQAKLIALMQQNQESERQAKLEQQQAHLERQARLERQQAQLEALKNKQPEPPLEREQLEQPQTRTTQTPEPPPPMVTLDEIVNKNSPKLKSYIGEVVEIDPKKGIYQKVGDRLVLHTIISNNAQVGKWSRIDYKEDGQIQVSDGSAYDMSRFKTSDPDKTKTQDQNQGR